MIFRIASTGGPTPSPRANPVRDADGAIVKWFGTCTDIHDQKEAAEVLRRSRDELEALVVARTAALMVVRTAAPMVALMVAPMVALTVPPAAR